MKRSVVAILILTLSVLGLTRIAQADRHAQQPPVVEQRIPAETTFLAIDITIDPQGQPLGAFQFELTATDASFTVAGVESGGHPAFDHDRPPYFDPVAQQGKIDRLILAEYAKPELAADQLPTDAVRVATVHVMLTLPEFDQPEPHEPLIQLTLTTAGNAEGERIDANISYQFRTPERPQ